MVDVRTALAGSFGRLSIMYYSAFLLVICWPTCGGARVSPWLAGALALLGIGCELVSFKLRPDLALRYVKVVTALTKIGLAAAILRTSICLLWAKAWRTDV